jgi:multicomponent Na+:H+ antiporter subunit F
MIEIEALFLNLFFLSLAISLFLILSRLFKGPSLADRVVAVDMFSTLLISAIVASAIYVDEVIYFDVAIIIALFSFFGTIIYARFINNQDRKKGVEQ